MNSRRITLEIQEEGRKQKAFIITPSSDRFTAYLKKKLKEYDIDVFVSPRLPEKLNPYSLFIFINPKAQDIHDAKQYPSKRFIFLFFHTDPLVKQYITYIHTHKLPNAKVIILHTQQVYNAQDIEKILWFCFSRSKEIYLYIYHPRMVRKREQSFPPPPLPKPRIPLYVQVLTFLSTPRMLFTAVAVFLGVVHILFIPPLILTTVFNYMGTNNLIDQNMATAQSYAVQAESTLAASEWLYRYARPTLLLFSLARYSDDVFQANRAVNTIIRTSLSLQREGQDFTSLLFKKNKTNEEVAQMNAGMGTIAQDIEALNDNLIILQDKIPRWSDKLNEVRTDIDEATSILETSRRMLPFFDDIFAKNGTKTYLLLFANNMELRPGGGFIGSFAILRMRNYTIDELTVYDVYDADGQLKAHINPPVAIREHLNQPHWFLRDSAFSPDFFTNYEQAQFFLEKQLDITGFDGGILLTTTSVQHVLEAVGDLYVPDFREHVNKDNFYLKAQLYAESDFFPGSQQKKRFLGSVMNQLLIELESAPVPEVLQAIKKAFNEKQIVAYFENEDLQQLVDKLYWSGRTIEPTCTTNSPNCVTDYIFPYDANLGVNKANFYVTRPLDLTVSIDAEGRVENTLRVTVQNNSFEDVFPGGRYKNYFQLLLPYTADVRTVLIDGERLRRFDERIDTYKQIGFLVTVPPKSESMIEVTYQLADVLENGGGTYQLVVQKQIGAPNSDFQLLIEVPENIHFVQKNFNALVKDNTLLYNTNLSTDKIFLLEFFKE